MNQIKTRLLIMLLGLGLALLIAPAAWAYTFNYSSGGFSSQAQAAIVYWGSPTTDGPYSGWDEDYTTSNANASYWGGTEFGSSSGDATGRWSYLGAGTSKLRVETGSGTQGNWYAEWGMEWLDSATASSGAVTKNQPGTTPGIFFQITDGTPGQLLNLSYIWNARVNPQRASVTLNGGSTDMFLCLNGVNLWSHEEIYRAPDTVWYGTFAANGTFQARVGDFIGINLATLAESSFSGVESGFASLAENWMTIEITGEPPPPPVPLPGTAGLMALGLAGLMAGGCRRRARSPRLP